MSQPTTWDDMKPGEKASGIGCGLFLLAVPVYIVVMLVLNGDDATPYAPPIVRPAVSVAPCRSEACQDAYWDYVDNYGGPDDGYDPPPPGGR